MPHKKEKQVKSLTLYVSILPIIILFLVFSVGCGAYFLSVGGLKDFNKEYLKGVLGNGTESIEELNIKDEDSNVRTINRVRLDYKAEEVPGQVEKKFEIYERVAESVINQDGTTTKILEVSDGESIRNVKEVIDKFGNRIMETTVEDENIGKNQKIYILDEKSLKDFRLSSKNQELNLRFSGEKKGSDLDFEYYPEKGLITIKDNTQNFSGRQSQTRIMLGENGFSVYSGGEMALINDSIVIDSLDGKIKIKNGEGEYDLKIMPDEIVKKIEESQISDDYANLRLEVSGGKLKYVVDGTSKQRLVGLFSILVPFVLTYDTETGELVGSDTTPIYKILDKVSF